MERYFNITYFFSCDGGKWGNGEMPVSSVNYPIQKQIAETAAIRVKEATGVDVDVVILNIWELSKDDWDMYRSQDD